MFKTTNHSTNWLLNNVYWYSDTAGLVHSLERKGQRHLFGGANVLKLWYKLILIIYLWIVANIFFNISFRSTNLLVSFIDNKISPEENSFFLTEREKNRPDARNWTCFNIPGLRNSTTKLEFNPDRGEMPSFLPWWEKWKRFLLKTDSNALMSPLTQK